MPSRTNYTLNYFSKLGHCWRQVRSDVSYRHARTWLRRCRRNEILHAEERYNLKIKVMNHEDT